MPEQTTPFDPAKYLDTPEAQATYLSEAFETNDPAFIAHSIGVVARARNMTEIAREADVSRMTLYKSLSEQGDPRLTTLIGVTKALGFTLSVQVTSPEAPQV